MNLFDKIAIDLDTLHNVNKIKKDNLKKKLGREMFIKKELSAFPHTLNSLIPGFDPKSATGALTLDVNNKKTNHMFPSIFINKDSNKGMEPLGANGKEKKALNLVINHHEMNELDTIHFKNYRSSFAQQFGHNALGEVVMRENNIVANGDKHIKRGNEYLVNYRREHEQPVIKEILKHINPEKAENFQFGDPNSRLNRHEMKKFNQYEKILPIQKWKELNEALPNFNYEEQEKYYKTIDPSGNLLTKFKNIMEHTKYVADNLDMDRFAKDKKHRYDMVKHVDKINKMGREMESFMTSEHPFIQNVANTHVGSYAKSNVAPPIPPRPVTQKPNKALSVVKTIAQHHI